MSKIEVIDFLMDEQQILVSVDGLEEIYFAHVPPHVTQNNIFASQCIGCVFKTWGSCGVLGVDMKCSRLTRIVKSILFGLKNYEN